MSVDFGRKSSRISLSNSLGKEKSNKNAFRGISNLGLLSCIIKLKVRESN